MTAATLSVLYRGPLSSCNYACDYCPFAKHHETARELAADRAALARFLDWVGGIDDRDFAVLFTPWGEALTRRWYQAAFAELSHRERVVKVAAQTNLSGPLDWLADCQRERVALWCTYHPSQISRADFLGRCEELRGWGVSHSVGMVGKPEDYSEIAAMRRELPPTTYLWINAYDIGDGVKYAYSAAERRRLTAIDPHFPTNTIDHPSLGRSCNAGDTVITVDGDGVIRRCHFIRDPIGRIDDPAWRSALQERRCPNAVCGCHLGYVHLTHLNQTAIYGDGLLERVPQ